MTGNLSDEELIVQIQKGDVLSYEILVKRYQQKLFFYLIRIVFDEHIAEEITFDSFYRLYTTIDRVNTTKKFSSYLYEIAKNKAIDYLRTKKSSLSIDEIELIADIDEFDSVLMTEEKSVEVRKAVEDLPKQYRDVIQLYYFEELSYKELSERLSLPINTIRTHIKRAKEQLKKTMSI